jgi:hypothetical protein
MQGFRSHQLRRHESGERNDPPRSHSWRASHRDQLPELSSRIRFAVFRARIEVIGRRSLLVSSQEDAQQEIIRLKSTPALDILYLVYRSFVNTFFDQKKELTFVLTIKEEMI